MSRQIVAADEDSTEVALAKRPPRLAARLRGVSIAGAVVIFGFMGGFTVWAATAPLSAGAAVRGVVSPDGSRKSVQHLEGGIVSEILVKEGDLVRQGQPLITLERVQAQSAFRQIRNTLSRRQTEAARLSAQISGATAIDFTAAIANADGDGNFDEFVAGQKMLFESSRRELEEREQLLRTQIQKLEAAVVGNRSRIEGSLAQRDLIDIEISDTKGLFERGLSRKPQLLALQRRRSELDTDIAALNADIRRAEIEAVEKQITLQNARTTYLSESSTELAKARSEIAGMQAKLASTQDVLARTQVVAPVAGYVLNLQVKTVGGVVRPGTDILQVVPADGDLIIEGRVAPQEIRNIEMGMAARVSFTSFPMRDMPMIPGRVLNVAADIITDPQTHESYYATKIAVDRAAFSAYARVEELKPGTPVEAYVESHKRVAMEYFVDPLVHSFRKSFREE